METQLKVEELIIGSREAQDAKFMVYSALIVGVVGAAVGVLTSLIVRPARTLAGCRKTDRHRVRGAGRGAPPSAACEVAHATLEPTRGGRRDRTEGERGCPALRSPSSNATQFRFFRIPYGVRFGAGTARAASASVAAHASARKKLATSTSGTPSTTALTSRPNVSPPM